MAAFVEYVAVANNANSVPIEGHPFASESIATGALGVYVPKSSMFVTITTDENGYIAIAQASAGAPSAGSNPRHRMVAGVARSFPIYSGESISYVAG